MTVNGGTIEGANKSIWMQDPSANANTGKLTIGANAAIKGNVYLTVTAGSTAWPVEVSIAAAALKDGSTVLTNNVPEKYKRDKHPARKVFQAIRIEVNDELNVLKEALKSTVSLLKSKGRMCVITFNSLEDRIVKDFFNSLAKEVQSSRRLPVQQIELDYSLVNRKVIIATDEELEKNNRAKSAKLRILEKI